MCHLGGGSMKGTVVTWLKGGAPGGSSSATCPTRARPGGRDSGSVWGSVGSPWSVEHCSAQLAELAFPGWEQGVSRWAGPAGRWHRRAGRERPGSAMAGAPRPLPK